MNLDALAEATREKMRLPPSDVPDIRAALAQARNDALESAAKWHEERAAELQKDKLEYMVKDMRACLGNCLLFIDAHVVCATAIRELKCSAAHPKEGA